MSEPGAAAPTLRPRKRPSVAYADLAAIASDVPALAEHLGYSQKTVAAWQRDGVPLAVFRYAELAAQTLAAQATLHVIYSRRPELDAVLRTLVRNMGGLHLINPIGDDR